MSKFKQYISIEKICTLYNISLDDLEVMEEYDLIQVTYIDNALLIDMDEIAKLERYIRLYFDLGINIQGLAAIDDLLKERTMLKAELRRYKDC